MELGQRIRKRREELEMSQDNLAKKMGYKSRSSINKIELGLNDISQSKIMAFAKALHTTPAYLMGWNDNPAPSRFDNLPSPEITDDYVEFPVIGEVAAGYECIAVEDWEGERIKIPSDFLIGHNKEDFFVLQVKGDSMYPQYQNGDKVLILKQSTMDYSGQIGVVIYNDDMGTLKKIEYAQGEDWMKLVPVNPNHPVVKIENEDLEHCRVLGIPKLLIREITD